MLRNQFIHDPNGSVIEDLKPRADSADQKRREPKVTPTDDASSAPGGDQPALVQLGDAYRALLRRKTWLQIVLPDEVH